VPDASVLLAFYLPAEPYKHAARAVLEAYVRGKLRLVIPALCRYEFCNGLSKAVRGLRGGERITEEEAKKVLRSFLGLGIEAIGPDGMELEIVEASIRFGCSAYDAVYLVLADRMGWPMVTADDRLHRALKDRFPQVRHVEEVASGLERG